MQRKIYPIQKTITGNGNLLLVFHINEMTSVKQSMKHKVCSNLADLPPWYWHLVAKSWTNTWAD